MNEQHFLQAHKPTIADKLTALEPGLSEPQMRKRELRREILVGRYFLQKYRQTNRWSELQAELTQALTNPSDRELFGLLATE